jgi:hypothetical protein
MMGSKSVEYDDQAAAKLLWQLKAIATKEVENIPLNSINSFFQNSEEELSWEDTRGRTVSVGSVDMLYSSCVTPILSFTSKTMVESKSFFLDDDDDNDDSSSNNSSGSIEHHDWSRPVESSLPVIKKTTQMTVHPLLGSATDIIKQCKKKRENFVGLCTNSGYVRGTLRKKVGLDCRCGVLEQYCGKMCQQEYHLTRIVDVMSSLLVFHQFSWKSFPEVCFYMLQTPSAMIDSLRDSLCESHLSVFIKHPSHSWKTFSCRIKRSIFNIPIETTRRNRYVVSLQLGFRIIYCKCRNNKDVFSSISMSFCGFLVMSSHSGNTITDSQGDSWNWQQRRGMFLKILLFLW